MLVSGIMTRSLVPSVSLEDLVNVLGSSDRDRIRGLFILHAIVIINRSHVSKWGFLFTNQHKMFANDIVDSFGSIFTGTRKDKIVHLMEKKFDRTKRSRVNHVVMGGAFDIEVEQRRGPS